MPYKELKHITSNHPVKETVERMVKCIAAEGWHVFARIDHAQEGKKAGIDLRPTELVLFGNPKIGTYLMQNSQQTALDLPMRALVMETENGEVQIVYNNTDQFKSRHRVSDEKTLSAITKVLEKVCQKAGE